MPDTPTPRGVVSPAPSATGIPRHVSAAAPRMATFLRPCLPKSTTKTLPPKARRRAGSPSALRLGAAARDDVHELLQVLGGPALESRGAVLLVSGHDRVAVVPVELRLGVEPERPAGSVGDLGEDLGVRLAAVGARVAEHDHGRARVEVLGDLGIELAPDPAVVRVAGDVCDAALPADP